MNHFKQMWEAAQDNVGFLVVAVIVIAVVIAAAYFCEKAVLHKNGNHTKVSATKRTTLIGMFTGISVILMLFEFPLGIFPEFYKIDISEVPVLLCSFLLGPLAGVLAELCKILLNLLINGTTSAFVGEFANFVIGSCLVIPASLIYMSKKSKKNAIVGLVIGSLVMTIAGGMLNAYLLLPFYAKLFGMNLDALVQMGTAVNGGIKNLTTFIFFAVVPFNIIKGFVVTLITILIYKPVSVILKKGLN